MFLFSKSNTEKIIINQRTLSYLSFLIIRHSSSEELDDPQLKVIYHKSPYKNVKLQINYRTEYTLKNKHIIMITIQNKIITNQITFMLVYKRV